MRAGRIAATVLAAPLLLALSACGGASSAPVTVTVQAGGGGATSGPAVPSITTAAGLSTACQLLTLKEAEAIVGTTLSPGQEGTPTQPTCTYNPDPKGTKTAQVTVLTEGAAESTYDTDVRIKHVFTSVPGIGDEAHQEDFAIFFKKGTLLAGITTVVLDDPSTVKTQLQQAAKIVVSRLP